MADRNEFNHRVGSVGAAIDEALCTGGTAKDVAAAASLAASTPEKPVKIGAGRVTSHVKHLLEDTAHKGKITIEKSEAGVLTITAIEGNEESAAQ